MYNLDCTKKYALSRAHKDDSAGNPNLVFGSAYHEAVENGLQAGIDMLEKNSMWSSTRLLSMMYYRLLAFLDKNNIKILANEIKIETRFKDCDEPYIGYIDAICEMNGKKYLLEFKTAKMMDFTFTAKDSQAEIYLSMYDGPEEVDGIIYIVNQKTEGDEIQLLKNGHLSTAKTINTTHEDYMKAVIKRYKTVDEAPDKVKEFLDYLKENEEPQIGMVIVRKTKEEKEETRTFVEELTNKIGQIHAKIKEVGMNAFMNKTKVIVSKFKCGGCQWKVRCLQYK